MEASFRANASTPRDNTSRCHFTVDHFGLNDALEIVCISKMGSSFIMGRAHERLTVALRTGKYTTLNKFTSI